MSEKRKSRTWKFCENTVKDMWWNKVLPTQEWSRDPLTSYELDFWLDYVSIVKVKSQKVWSRSVDFCGDGGGKTWRGWIPPPPLAEIGLRDQISREILVGVVIFLCLSKIYLSSFTWFKVHFKNSGETVSITSWIFHILAILLRTSQVNSVWVLKLLWPENLLFWFDKETTM